MSKNTSDKFNRGIALLFFVTTVFVVGTAIFLSKNGESFKYIATSESDDGEDLIRQEEEIPVPPPPPPPPVHIKTPEAVKGIYMTSWVASTKDWRANLVDFMTKSEVNAVVIDVKDYTGKISYEVYDPELKAVGSSDPRVKDIREFIKTLHEKNIYTIARIAVFQDPFYVKLHPDLAIKTKKGTVWKDRKGLTWVDPCAKDYWDYIVKVSKETEQAGFDELNFDYIRFASDGDMKDATYTHCAAGAAKSDLLEEFFVYLKENTKDIGVPISADLFGMVATNKDDLGIGQVLEKAAPHFDYICPMVYPSHYPSGYKNFKNPNLYPYEVINDAMKVASERLTAASSSPLKLRPWLQDFKLGGVVYDAVMIKKEKQAVYDAGLTSWLMWDPTNKYTRGAFGSLPEEAIISE